MKVAFYTLGCKTNQFETQALEALFSARGHEIVDFAAFADLYIVNTCTVTAVADKKSRIAAKHAKRTNPNGILAICGCYSQMKPDEARALCGADIVLGTTDKGALVALAEDAVCGKSGGDMVRELWRHGEFSRPCFDVLPAGGLLGRTRALLKIQDGCQNFCTYCLIPFARGPSRSLPFETALCQAKELDRLSYREIVITGIEISSYGLDLPEKPQLSDLICGICDGAPNARIRLGSLEPRSISDAFALACSQHKNLCPHFHLSLQSGCDATLKAMNRRYDSARFFSSCEILRKFFPDCAITADLIVGFPTESDEDFAQSLDFVEKCDLSQVHIFPFSPRSGTRAAQLKPIPKDVMDARVLKANTLCDNMKARHMSALIGRTVPILFENGHGKSFSGHCPQYWEVTVFGENLHNLIKDVEITSIKNGRLIGVIK